MLDRELVTRRIKAITDNAWRQEGGNTTTINGLIEYIFKEVTLEVLEPLFIQLSDRIEELENGKDGKLQKPQRGTKTSTKVGNGSTAEAR